MNVLSIKAEAVCRRSNIQAKIFPQLELVKDTAVAYNVSFSAYISSVCRILLSGNLETRIGGLQDGVCYVQMCFIHFDLLRYKHVA